MEQQDQEYTTYRLVYIYNIHVSKSKNQKFTTILGVDYAELATFIMLGNNICMFLLIYN